MSLRIYTVICSITFLLILLFFTIISSIAICLTQFDSSFLFLYIFRSINHIFELYNIIILTLFFVVFVIVTYYIKKTRKLFFTILLSVFLIIFLNINDLKSYFLYKSQPLDKYFYIYFISYTLSFMIWYVLLKKTWMSLLIENKKN
ncbi:Uncharacterised protein [Chryseobacterium indoltheticum]|uniref:Uncharacterized protein n=1 Tax=Chryseobacterium indoltheticum TaxID=254 RepID=A0A381FQI9_9FLAO|nr:Uncharacterised protein [Chryseobacterium indoltheticum]